MLSRGLPRARRALVLGGTGFVGRQVCAALSEAGYAVVAVGRRPTPHGPGRLVIADLVSADIPALLAEAGARVVVNAAGAVWHPTEQQMIESNSVVVERLLAALAVLDRPTRLIQLGSSKEYGSGPVGVAVTEDTSARPVGTYGRTKLRATEAVLGATRRGEVDGVVLRLPTLIGPDSPRSSLLGRVTAELAAAAHAAHPAVVRLSALTASQDFLDVNDFARAVTAAARSNRVLGRIVNLGYGAAIPVRSVVDLLIAQSGVPTTVIEQDQARQAAWLDWQRLDISAAAELLGWRPRRTLRESLAAVWSAADPRNRQDCQPDHCSVSESSRTVDRSGE